MQKLAAERSVPNDTCCCSGVGEVKEDSRRGVNSVTSKLCQRTKTNCHNEFSTQKIIMKGFCVEPDRVKPERGRVRNARRRLDNKQAPAAAVIARSLLPVTLRRRCRPDRRTSALKCVARVTSSMSPLMTSCCVSRIMCHLPCAVGV